jgi:hypothetical protein
LVLIFPRVTVQTEDLLLGPVDSELASGLNVGVVGEVECPEAGLSQVREEDIPPLAKVGVPQFVAVLQVGGGEELVRFRVAHRDHVVRSNFRSVGDVA